MGEIIATAKANSKGNDPNETPVETSNNEFSIRTENARTPLVI